MAESNDDKETALDLGAVSWNPVELGIATQAGGWRLKFGGSKS